MNIKIIKLFLVLLFITQFISGQDSIPGFQLTLSDKPVSVNGFIRGGAYYDLNRDNSDPYFSSGFSDLGLKLEFQKSGIYKAFADVRFRYGSEFRKQVKSVDIREAYIDFTGKRWNISMGQKILKWGRADFTNPVSKFNPQNLIIRSPDREDMDMGNILSSVKWYPSGNINIQAVLMPFYRPSVLIIDPVPLPENTSINQINGLIADKQMLSYGFRTDFHLRGIDWGISWFNGFEPMPGVSLTSFSLDLSGQVPVTTTQLTVKPYKTQVLGIDLESVLGPIGLRGEAAWSNPSLPDKTNEYVPFGEIKWVTGLDWSKGSLRFIAEYSGKFLPGFEPAIADPLIGTEPDYAKLGELLAIPGFDINEYVRQQVGAFNRLFNYQLKKYYHSAAFRVEAELLYGRILPSVLTSYNFTSQDVMIIPEVRYKPSDGLTIIAGAEIFKGRKGSLYDIVNDFMNTIYVSLKVDF
ncbi:MAG: hypothetical protein C0408_06875 [Odoribacter sp.]|nr:hypothetical protein [Odoribacter sp.]